MLFTREQLEGFYYLMVGILLLVGIPLFCERFHSGGDDGGEEEALWADAGGSGAGYGYGAGSAGGSGAGYGYGAGSDGAGSAGGSGSGSLYEDSLFLPPSNSSSSNTPISAGGSGAGRSGGSQGRSYGQREVKVVEINRADSALLTTVRGIGPVYASIIIRYRERLGGFFDTRQLKELNLTYFDYDAISPYLRVDTTFIEKHHIENLTFKELVHHPYLEYETVSMIFDYMRQNPGQPVTIEQLGEAGILRSAQIKKLSPYFY